MMDERNRDERDDIGTLLRMAGRRQAVPEDRTERVRAAAQAEWRQQVRQRSRRRTLWTVAALAAAASLALAITLRIAPPGTDLPSGAAAVITVESLTGPAWVRDSSDAATVRPRALEIGASVSIGSELATDNGGRMALRLASGHSVRLDTSTRVRLLEADSFALDRGTVYVDSGKPGPTIVSLTVRTPFGVVEEIGTQFEVSLASDAVRVRLREGAVVLRDGLRTHTVSAGNEIRLASDASTTTRELSTYGSEWGWIAGIAPMPDLEGKSPRVLLDWVARERGWRLAFADPDLARSADEIVLQGALDELTLDQALDAVLPTCRMTHRLVDGVLMIEAAP